MNNLCELKLSSGIIILLTLCLAFFTFGCDPNAQNEEFETLRSHLDTILEDMSPVKAATDVKMIIDDPTESAKYTIVSVRSNEHYLKGHVPGAINIPWRTIAKEESLKMIPTDKPVIVYCYTGHTGQVASTVLNLLGYEAYNMKYGMMGWTDDPEVLNQSVFDCEPPNYDVETGE